MPSKLADAKSTNGLSKNLNVVVGQQPLHFRGSGWDKRVGHAPVTGRRFGFMLDERDILVESSNPPRHTRTGLTLAPLPAATMSISREALAPERPRSN